jgi:hypothetical protein
VRRPRPRRLGLDRLERWFQSEIVRPHEPRRAREADRPRPADLVLPSRTLTARERVAIYQRAYFARLRDCLAEEFKAVHRVLGDAAFDRLSRAYLAKHPSRHYSLNELGRRLPRYLGGRAPIARRALVRDLARLENAMSEVFDAESAALLDAAAVAAVAPGEWPRARLHAVPAFRLLALDFPVNAIVTAVRREEPIPDVSPKRTFVAVYRKGFVVWRMDLSEPAWRLLRALAAGRTIEAAIRAARRAWRGDRVAFEQKLSQWFRDFVAEGIFHRVETAPNEAARPTLRRVEPCLA